MNAHDLRATSGQTADDRDPDTNGKPENEARKLEVEQIGREAREAEASVAVAVMLDGRAVRCLSVRISTLSPMSRNIATSSEKVSNREHFNVLSFLLERASDGGRVPRSGETDGILKRLAE